MLHLIGQHLQYQLDDGGFPGGERFAELFADAFVDSRWPDAFLGDIMAHWSSGPTCSPRIEFANTDRILVDGRYVEAFGVVDQLGHRLRFNGRHVCGMPEDVVVAVIAHELLHVLEYAKGIADRPSGDREQWVDRMLSRLGFDPQSVQTWVDGSRMTTAEWQRENRLPTGRYFVAGSCWTKAAALVA